MGKMIFFKRYATFSFLGKNNVLITTPFKQKEIFFTKEDNGKYFDLINLKFKEKYDNAFRYYAIVNIDDDGVLSLNICARIDNGTSDAFIKSLDYTDKQETVDARIYEEK